MDERSLDPMPFGDFFDVFVERQVFREAGRAHRLCR
jgi:hypothetical protein